jgi:glycosyltransferase involved in cell wall biosynthesis
MMACGLEVVVTRLPPAQYFVDDSVHWCKPNDIGSIAESIIKACAIKGNSKNSLINKKLIHEEYNWEQRQDGYVALFNA